MMTNLLVEAVLGSFILGAFVGFILTLCLQSKKVVEKAEVPEPQPQPVKVKRR